MRLPDYYEYRLAARRRQRIRMMIMFMLLAAAAALVLGACISPVAPRPAELPPVRWDSIEYHVSAEHPTTVATLTIIGSRGDSVRYDSPSQLPQVHVLATSDSFVVRVQWDVGSMNCPCDFTRLLAAAARSGSAYSSLAVSAR